MKYVLIVALMILGPVSYTHAKAAPGQAHRASTTKVVTGEDALRVANQLVRTGLVADGVDTPAGLGSRVYGTYKDKSATCDFPWQQREAVRCSIDSSLAVDESQYVTGEFAK